MSSRDFASLAPACVLSAADCYRQPSIFSLHFGQRNDHIIEYYRREVEELKGGSTGNGDKDELIPLRMKPGISTVYGKSSKKYVPDATGVIFVSAEDAAPLIADGFERNDALN